MTATRAATAGQLVGDDRRKPYIGFIVRRRGGHVVSVDDRELGLRRIWTISLIFSIFWEFASG